MIKKEEWLIYERKDYEKVKSLVDYNQVICLIVNNKTYEAYYTGDKQFNTMQVMRIVIAPYRDKGGQPRGWFPGSDGTPLRWTGIGNVVRVEGKDAEQMTSDFLDLMTKPIDFEIIDKGDYVFKKLDDKTIGVASKKLYELIQ